MITKILLQQTIIMFLLMMLGLLLARKGLLTERGSGDLANILLYTVVPCVVIRSYITEYTPEKLRGLLLSVVIALLAFAVAIALPAVCYGRRRPIENYSVAFSNAGFIGIPLVSAVFGTEAAFYVASFATILNLLQWTYGIVVLTGRRDSINLKKVFVNPVCIALAVGLVLFFTGFQLPQIVLDSMGYIAGMNTPVAMIVLGFYLSKSSVKEILLDKSLYGCVLLRLIAVPLLTIGLFRLLPFCRGEIAMIVLIAAATPIATSTAIFAQVLGQDYRRAVGAVCQSTLLSVLTIPLVIALAEALLL